MIGRIIFLSVFGKIVFVRSSFLLYPIGDVRLTDWIPCSKWQYAFLSYNPFTARYERDYLCRHETTDKCRCCNTGNGGDSRKCQVMLEYRYP